MTAMRTREYDRHADRGAALSASPQEVFSFIDDHTRLTEHMSRSSWMMGGGRVRTEFDELGGHAVGSHIRMAGRAFGFRLYLDEVITRYEPPTRKSWQTVGTPELVIIGGYRMDVAISGDPSGARLRVSIDYDMPIANRFLGVLFARAYAIWCVGKMVGDAQGRFH